MPAPERLAAVATVLCLYPRRQRDALAGWLASVSAQRCIGEGVAAAREAIVFRDARGRACWRLHLLPDSDFLAWDLAVAGLPAADAERSRGRLARALRGWLGGGWSAQTLRLQLARDEAGRRILVADAAEPSALGLEHARRIAAAEGARLRTGPDTCCCMARRAASEALKPQALASH
ncbi:hypothetical protein [Lysobacter sp. cf310]|uniref:hypothetical protein n=1 Tax=Lysobacter sp. cf310 TaxID=1761790 RepID=UPI0008ED630B|nr:hypothetical protein [Lysobacter sp. cf310]SFK39163.1 hypothetical protein SAMN04487938_0608 [Lysobacter sp. cf310]